MKIYPRMQRVTCAEPESFVRGCPNLITFFFLSWWGDRGSKCHYKWTIIGQPAKRHLNGMSLACQWWPNIDKFQSNTLRISRFTFRLLLNRLKNHDIFIITITNSTPACFVLISWPFSFWISFVHWSEKPADLKQDISSLSMERVKKFPASTSQSKLQCH